jgi:Pyruvate/2-oxoacid:ferredoxin oxidoreductase gamma subunit
VEREIAFTGIGGQSIQLGAQILARAAVLEGRQVMLLGTYGGTMRGGNTEATLVVADAPISTPPIVSQTWAALVMHHRYWEALRPKLRPGGVVAINSTLFEGALDREQQRVLDVPATRIATDQDAPLSACLVLVAAFANATELLGLDSLLAGMRESLPPYRRQHLEANEKALRAGFAAASAEKAPAFPERATA